MSIKKKTCLNIEEVKRDIREVLQKVIEIMHPKNLISKNLYVDDDSIVFDGKYRVSLKNINNIYVVGFGKASGSMAEETEKNLGDLISKGIVIILRGTKEEYNVRKIEFVEANHPIPSIDNVEDAKKNSWFA